MNKIAFMLAYSDPEKALALYVQHFGDTDSFEKTSSVTKEAFMQDAMKWVQQSYAKNPRMWQGLGGAALGAGAGYMMGGGKGALMGAGMGGLGGYYAHPMWNRMRGMWGQQQTPPPQGQPQQQQQQPQQQNPQQAQQQPPQQQPWNLSNLNNNIPGQQKIDFNGFGQ